MGFAAIINEIYLVFELEQWKRKDKELKYVEEPFSYHQNHSSFSNWSDNLLTNDEHIKKGKLN